MSLKNGDLAGTIQPKITIDVFRPKAGKDNDVIVVAFYLNDQDPAQDLNTFIQRGFVDTLDVEVSPATDEDGNYLVFVEMNRDTTFPNKFQALLKDVENVSGKMDWEINAYLADDRIFQKTDAELFDYIILDPETYVPKEEYKMNELSEGITRFFQGSLLSGLTVHDNTVTLSSNGKKIVAEVVDVGDYDTVIGRNFLTESAFDLKNKPQEASVLRSILGNCEVLPLGKYLFVGRDEQVMLLKNTEIKYGI
jgi:hypothetical protein